MRIEDAGCAASEADGDEHRHEDEGTGNNGHRHVAHRVFRRFVRTCVARIEFRLHGFHDDNGVVHHRTDGKHEGKERQQVKRKASHGKAGERAYQRYYNRYGGDEGRLEVLQEEVYHEHHQEDGNKQGLFYVRDGCQKEVVARHHLDELHAFGQVFAQLFQFGADAVVCLFRIRTCKLEAEERDARMSVCFAVEGVADSTKLHVGDVLEPKQGAVRIGAYHDVLELRDFLQTSFVLQGVLIVVLDAVAMRAVHGLLAQLSGWRLQVLLCQSIRDVGGNDVVLRHQLRFHPDAQRVCAAKQHDVAHALYALDLRNDVDVEVVRDEVLVVLAVLAAQRVNLQERRLALHGLHTNPCHIGGQQALRPRNAVLHVDRCHVGVCALLEDDVNGGRTCVGGRTAHVQHVLYTVDGLFKRLDDGVHHGIRTCTRVGSINAYRWRSDVGILL